jgi:hypothetical protein
MHMLRRPFAVAQRVRQTRGISRGTRSENDCDNFWRVAAAEDGIEGFVVLLSPSAVMPDGG